MILVFFVSNFFLVLMIFCFELWMGLFNENIGDFCKICYFCVWMGSIFLIGMIIFIWWFLIIEEISGGNICDGLRKIVLCAVILLMFVVFINKMML